MDALSGDLVYSLRSLLKAPRFTAVAIVTLALGIGANSAIFSVVDAVLLRPLPVAHADRIVNLTWEADGHLQQLSAIKFEYWRERARSFDAVAAWRTAVTRVDHNGQVVAARTLAVTRDFFRVLDTAPAAGRVIGSADEGSGVAMISAALWRTRLGGVADPIGISIRLDDRPVTIVGVLPESFAFPYETEAIDVIVPLRMEVDPNDIAENWPMIARLRDGVTHAHAQSDVAGLNAAFRATHSIQVSDRARGMRLATFSELYVIEGVRRALWILMGGVTLVLLIACANVANLFLLRATTRQTEMALRAALGGTRWRIARLVLTESMAVALAGGALGLVVGHSLSNALVALTPIQIARLTTGGLDARVVAFTCLVSLATSLLCGVVAAWPAARAQLSETLRQRGHGTSGPSRLRQGLLVAQATLSAMLLVGAGLLVMTLIHLTRVDPGFDADGLLAVRLPSKPPGYDTSHLIWKFQLQVFQRFEHSRVITSIASASSLPLERGINTRMTVRGRPDVIGTVEWRAVTPGYFRTLAIAVTRGRVFENADANDRPRVAVVNDAFAQRFVSGDSPLGQVLDVGSARGTAGQSVEIVGVVADIREMSLRAEPRPTIYVPQAQAPDVLSNLRGTMPVFLIATHAPREVERELSAVMRALDPALPQPQIFPLGDLIARSLARERFGATLLSTLASLALALTAFGIYGVLAYVVQQRRREIGIRMALGATGQQVTRLVVSQGLAPVIAGVTIGMMGSIATSRLVAGFLWGVTPTDPGTLTGGAVILLGVAIVASSVPAREAVKVDPARTLHAD